MTVTSGHDDLALLRLEVGELIDALHDDLAYEINQCPDVVAQIRKVCGQLGDDYQGYMGEWF